MTVQNSQYKSLYATDGVVVAFPFNFKVTDPSWIECYLAEEANKPPVQVTEFSVSLNPDQETAAGGVVTFVDPPAAGTLAILRQTPLTQELDYTAYDAFPAESHEKGMDKLTYTQQWTLGEIARGVRYAYVTDFEDLEFITLQKYTGSGQLLYWKDENTLASANPSDADLATITYVDAQDEALQSQITANTSAIGVNANNIASNAADIADLNNNKADKSTQVTTGNYDTLVVDNPTLDSNVTFTVRTNNPNAVLQLDSFGLVPSAHLPPNGGLSIFGFWDASTGDNPTDTRPDAQPYKSGDTYIIDPAGTINLLNTTTGVYEPTAVIQGDLIIYVVSYNAVTKGWAKGQNVDVGSTTASNVIFTPAGTITSNNVQDGMEELDAKKLAKSGGDVSGSIVLDNNVQLAGRKVDLTAHNLAMLNASDQMLVGQSSIVGMTFRNGGVYTWQDAAGLSVATLSQAGDLGLTGGVSLENNKSITGRNSADDADLELIELSPMDAVFVGNGFSPMELLSSSLIDLRVAGQLKAQVNATGLEVTGNITATGDITAFSGTPLSNQALANRVDTLEAKVTDLLSRVNALENP